jgi:hypothetical protein
MKSHFDIIWKKDEVMKEIKKNNMSENSMGVLKWIQIGNIL